MEAFSKLRFFFSDNFSLCQFDKLASIVPSSHSLSYSTQISHTENILAALSINP